MLDGDAVGAVGGGEGPGGAAAAVDAGEDDGRLDEAALKARAEYEATEEYKIVHAMPIFSTLDEEQMRKVAEMLTREHFARNASLIRVGAAGTRLYLKVQGTIKIIARGKHVADISNPAVLGEISILDDVPTTAGCVAKDDTWAWCFSRCVCSCACSRASACASARASPRASVCSLRSPRVCTHRRSLSLSLFPARPSSQALQPRAL